MIKHLISPERISSSFVCFLILQNPVPQAEQLEGKAFCHLCFHVSISFLEPQQFEGLSKARGQCFSSSDPAFALVLTASISAPGRLALTGGTGLGGRRRICQAHFSPALQLALRQSGEGREADASPLGAFTLCRHLPGLWKGRQVTQSPENTSQS